MDLAPPALTHYFICRLQVDISIHQGLFYIYLRLRLALGKQIPKLEECLDKTSWIYCEGHKASVNYPVINDIQTLSAIKDILKMDLKHLWLLWNLPFIETGSNIEEVAGRSMAL